MMSNFIEFLIKAKQATYAGQGDEATTTPLVPGSKQLEYQEQSFLYRDIYVGMFAFVGQEIVYDQHTPLWSMSYAGGLRPRVSQSWAGPVYAFLRQALLTPWAELPVRGPLTLTKGEWRYLLTTQGTIEQFWGTEQIFKGDDDLYHLHFSGGYLA